MSGGGANNGENNSPFGIILLGNTGVGKSFLGNILLGREAFKHECDSSSVTHVTEFQAYTVDGESYAVFNIPGLLEDDQAAVDRNKQEIYKAFQQRPNSVVGFVFTGGAGGRLRDEDLVAFNAIHNAFNFKQESLVIIINDLPDDRQKDYEAKTTIKLEHLLKIPNVKVCFLNRINKNDAREREQLCMKLVESIIVQCEPHIHKKAADIQLNVDVIKQLKLEAKKQQEKFESQISLLKNEIAEKQREIEAENVQRDREYEALRQEMAEQKRQANAEKLSMQQQLKELENRAALLVQQAHKKKKKRWYQKLF